MRGVLLHGCMGTGQHSGVAVVGGDFCSCHQQSNSEGIRLLYDQDRENRISTCL